MPARLTSLIALGLVLGALLTPAAAVAQSPFTPLPQPAPEPTPTVVPADDDEDDGLSDTQQLLIAAAGIVLLVGIGWAIVRDARSNAPVQDRSHDPVLGAAGEEGRHRGSRAPKQQRVKTNRQKAKAARQARKRNR